MGRPQRTSDIDLLDLIDAAIAERDSTEPWGLQDIAPAAGMSPAGLIKRFGSKQGLLLALTRRWIERIPTSPIGADVPLAELRGYIEDNFAAPSSSMAIFGLGELMRDLWSPTAAELLRDGWRKQVNYFSTLLALLPLRTGFEPHETALILLDALHGSLYRRAVDFDPTTPTHTLDNLLKGWT
ncbi:TetR/AcrR family transcriptional regulator [Arthrobacter sp. GMC3]|uniref:TetR/AcrR family transcriptional regulator n=1 Tax=Arthrobacter sp. GMC3 TaxID=2058894 RepID=UPI000CE2D548|nr:TetR/AcrR family transcriptional regulator [Arthrobacter sp. GMC3]